MNKQMLDALKRWAKWCEDYPSDRYYDHGTIVRIARLMDEINECGCKAITAAEQQLEKENG